jgi:type IX secretion system PorP/SprF family membrane protein
MFKNPIKICFFLYLFTIQNSFCQEGVPVYSDYLSDNYYLIHPSMAGAANCDKIRLTARKQWFGQDNAPALQTLSYNGRIGERSGVGVILLNDKNGYHSQFGGKLTYAHHIMFSRNELDLNQLSFGLNAGLVQGQLDESSFNAGIDPVIFGGIQNVSYFNTDVGASYNLLNFYTHFTIKNLLSTKRTLYSDIESNNLRKYLLSAGYVFGEKNNFQYEPSFLVQYTEKIRETNLDVNVKIYKEINLGKIWGGLSYRRGLNRTSYSENGTLNYQRLQYITPILGANIGRFMFAYTYSYLYGNIKFDQAGFHQITLGMNLFCRKEKYDCNCPAVN